MEIKYTEPTIYIFAGKARHGKDTCAAIVNELKEYGITPVIHDPIADAQEAKKLYDIEFVSENDIKDMDVVILAVAHDNFQNLSMNIIDGMFKTCSNDKKVIIDIKGCLNRKEYENANYVYWRL